MTAEYNETLPAEIRAAVAPLERSAGPIRTVADLARVVEGLSGRHDRLAGFLGDMVRGMDGYRRTFGLSSVALETFSEDGPALPSRLGAPGGAADMARAMAEVKLHQLAVMEGYYRATSEGSRHLLGEVDPQAVAEEAAKSGIQVGPVKLPGTFKPLLVQAVWEEMLRRFDRLRRLESADFDRFFREGFRSGYRECVEAQRPDPAEPSEEKE